MNVPTPADAAPSLLQARLCIFLAAILWSLGSFFAKILTQPTWLGVHEPEITPLQIAFFRIFFAGLVLLPVLRLGQVTVKLPMLWMVLCFAAMNGMFISAMTLGKAATAILLQYTAPLWMYLACIFLLKEAANRRSTIALFLGLAGIGIIVAGGWENERLAIVLLGLGSGLTYAGVMMFLRVLRRESSVWLTICNHLGAALLLAPLGLIAGLPSWEQLLVLMVFGTVQMGIPYVLMARGLRTVSPQEAAAITLLEPILNPLWAYLVSPETEALNSYIFLGGALILGGLAWRYWPGRKT